MDKIIEASKDPLFIAKFWMNVKPIKVHNLLSNEIGQCWEWIGSGFSKDGYGIFSFKAQSYRSHRVSYYLFNGTISKDLFICHKCDNPKCLKPQHLYEGTGLDNARDRDLRGRRVNKTKNKKHRSSQYNGVTFYKNAKLKKWACKYFFNYKCIFIGNFITELEAAQAYDDYIKANGIDKPLNFP